MRFRRGVYANRGQISAGCQVLLLRLSDDMDGKCVVSVPRSQLAVDMACPPARITEWIQQAKDAGFLSVVRRARPKVTAVYQGLYVNPLEVRPAVPLEDPIQGYGNPDPTEVRPAVPLSGVQRYAQQGSQVVVREPHVDGVSTDRLEQRGNDEDPSGAPGTDLGERSAS